jgi:hypothetical protein
MRNPFSKATRQSRAKFENGVWILPAPTTPRPAAPPSPPRITNTRTIQPGDAGVKPPFQPMPPSGEAKEAFDVVALAKRVEELEAQLKQKNEAEMKSPAKRSTL